LTAAPVNCGGISVSVFVGGTDEELDGGGVVVVVSLDVGMTGVEEVKVVVVVSSSSSSLSSSVAVLVEVGSGLELVRVIPRCWAQVSGSRFCADGWVSKCVLTV
jgi:hypothetical protein